MLCLGLGKLVLGNEFLIFFFMLIILLVSVMVILNYCFF